MDLEICKKCKNFPDFYLLDYKREGKFYFIGINRKTSSYNFCSSNCVVSYETIKINKDLMRNINESMVVVKERDLFVKNNKVFPDESCPYYCEHKLIEWNKIQ